MANIMLVTFLLVCLFAGIFSNPIIPFPDVSRMHPCMQPAQSGLCLAYFPSYYYNPASDSCETFIYGGCQGNENRFWSEEECLAKCKGFKPETNSGFKLFLESNEQENKTVEKVHSTETVEKIEVETVEEVKSESSDKSESTDVKSESSDVKSESSEVKSESSEVKSESSDVKSQSSEDKNERNVDEDLCKLPKVEGPCRAMMPMFYSDDGLCKQFMYGGCQGNDNRFKSLEDCESRCGTQKSSEEAASSTTTTAATLSSSTKESAQ